MGGYPPRAGRSTPRPPTWALRPGATGDADHVTATIVTLLRPTATDQAQGPRRAVAGALRECAVVWLRRAPEDCFLRIGGAHRRSHRARWRRHGPAERQGPAGPCPRAPTAPARSEYAHSAGHCAARHQETNKRRSPAPPSRAPSCIGRPSRSEAVVVEEAARFAIQGAAGPGTHPESCSFDRKRTQ